MSTKSAIGRLNANGTVSAIYCHCDGHLSGAGRILLDSYKDSWKVDQLIALGSLYRIKSKIGEKHDLHNPVNDWCIACGRDIGKSRTEARVFLSIDSYVSMFKAGVVNYYLYDNGIWYVNESQSVDEGGYIFLDLPDALPIID
jgi:hypothetical protein